jgi:hypothetical protein
MKRQESGFRARWRLAVANLVVGLFWLFPRVGFVVFPISEEGVLDEYAVPLTYLYCFFFCMFAFFLWRFAQGYHYARIVVAILLSLMTLSIWLAFNYWLLLASRMRLE